MALWTAPGRWHARCMSARMLRDDSVSNFLPDPERLDERLRALHAHESETRESGARRRPRTRTRLGDTTRFNPLWIRHESEDWTLRGRQD